MDVEINTEAQNKRLNTLVAITVVILSVFMGISKIKDDNLVQTMQLAKADAVDRWSEYQAKKVKLHLTENSLRQAKLLAAAGVSRQDAIEREITSLTAETQRYGADAEKIKALAQSNEAKYDLLNYRDDQFDMSDAALSIAIAVAAVASLTDRWLPLYFSWCSGAFGILFGLAGFFGWQLHPDWLAAALS